MIGFLRCVGLLNSAVWFGGAVFLTLFAGPAMFSGDMQTLLDKNYPYYSGAIAQILIGRYFRMQLLCGVIALLHLGAEQLYFGRAAQKLRIGLLACLLVLSVSGAFWLQPKMKSLHGLKYAPGTPAQTRQAAANSFRSWHGVSQVANLAMIAGLGVYLWRIVNPNGTSRFH